MRGDISFGAPMVTSLNTQQDQWAGECLYYRPPACIPQDMLFHEYRIESRAGNEILFEANVSLLLQALNSGKTAPTCQIKLAKRAGQPCLSVETRVSVKHW